MKRILPLLLALILLAACGRTDPDKLPQSMTDPMTADHTLWQQEPYYILQFNVDSVISNAPNVMASASRIIISQGGTYLISGTLQDAQLVIDAPAGDTVRLVLRGVDMQCERGPAILSRGAGPVVLLLEDGTENTVTDGKNYFYSGSAVIESVISTGGDLLVTGGGSLSVSASHNDALHSEKRLVLSGFAHIGEMKGDRKVRVTFDGHTAFEPIIGNIILEYKTPINILYADTKTINGNAEGEMILQLPQNGEIADKIVTYFKEKNLGVEEVDDYAR